MNRRRPGFTMIELIAVVAIITMLISLLLPAVQSTREAARRAQCANNLMQIGIAVRSYESTHRVLPPGVVDAKGPVVESPTAYQFSWVAQILPFVEQKNVYRHLDFNAGVYQVANISARSATLNVLLCPSDVRPGSLFSSSGAAPMPGLPTFATSSYAACHNDIEAPIDANNRGVFFLNSRVRYEDVEDGLSHTIFFGEKIFGGDELGWASGTRTTLRNAGTPINRTKLDTLDLMPFLERLEPLLPRDPDMPGMESSPRPPVEPPAPVVPLKPIPVGGFGSQHPSGANFCFGDGSVRFLRATLDARVLRLLAARSDGETIGDDQF